MTRKVWEVLFLLLVLAIVIQLGMEALKPYLPILGLVILIVIAGVLVRVFWYKKKMW